MPFPGLEPDRPRPGRCRRRPATLAVAAALVLAAVGLAAGRARADEIVYRLGPEDKVRLKVFEWRASQDQVFEWKALNDDFIVSANGSLSVPLIGDVPVKGMPPEDAAREIGERLRKRMGLMAPPDTALDIVQYRPFFVAGDVVHPGPYPFHPGLTVLEAVAIAGGVLRPADLGFARIGREVIAGEGDLGQLAREYDAAVARRARLQAEVADAPGVPMPAAFASRASSPGVVQAIKAETQIFDAHRRAFATQTAALQDLKTFLQKEVESLTAQLATIDTQTTLINKELTGVASLVEKGMAVAPRQLALERSIAQIQGDRLGMETNKLRVLGEISKADIALIELRNSRATEAATELRDVQSKLDDIVVRTETGTRLLYEARITAPRLLADRARKQAREPSYALVRRTGTGPETLAVDDATDMAPGDTVKVTLPLPADGPADLDAAAPGVAALP